MSEHVEACLNCETPLQGVWCPQCGQANRRARLEPHDLARDAFDQLIGFDTRIGRTLIDFTRRPGAAALAYVRGHRARYVNPLKYMLFAVALYFLLLQVFGIKISELSPQPPPPASADPLLTEVVGALLQIVNDGLRALLFMAPPIFAWVAGWLLGRRPFALRAFRLRGEGGLLDWAGDFLRAPRHFNFAESCSLWLHVFAHVILIVTLPAICLVAAGFRSMIFWAILPTMGYYFWAARQFYGRGWFYSAFVILIAYLVFQLFYVTVLVACMLVAFWISG